MCEKSVLVSIIIPLYHGKRYIKNLLDIFSKNAEIIHKNIHNKEIELIFVNDDPTEKITLEDEMARPFKIKYLPLEKNSGIHVARVKGLKLASGEYILFFDQDDALQPNALFSQLQTIEDCDASLCNGWYRSKKIIFKDKAEQENAIQLESHFKRNRIISPGQVLLRRNRIPEEWKENIIKRNGTDDMFLWFIMIKRKYRFAINTQCLYEHCENGKNNSLNWQEMIASGNDLFDALKKIRLFSDKEEKIYEIVHIKRIQKFKQYLKIDKLLEHADALRLQNLQTKRIAIYGMGVYGYKIVELFGEKGVKIQYGIDMEARNIMKCPVKLYHPEDLLPPVDLMIVTAVFDFDSIKEILEKKISCDIVRLDDFLENTINKRI